MKTYILPFRGLIVHPGLTVPVFIDNPLSVEVITAANSAGNGIILAPQRTHSYPSAPGDLYDIATVGEIVQIFHVSEEAIHAVIKTKSVVKLSDIILDDGLFSADITPVPMQDNETEEHVLSLRDKVVDVMREIASHRKFRIDKLRNVMRNCPLGALVDTVTQMAGVETDVAVKILATPSWREKFIMLLEQTKTILETAKIEESIDKRVQLQMETGRREAILQEKMRALQKEMGEDAEISDSASMRSRIEKSAMPADAKEKAMAEFKRMRSVSQMSSEGGILKTYLDELLSMPWGKSDRSDIDLKVARSVLDSEHSGMLAVKERILEHIAVMKKTGKNQGSILCLVGAPGVGKTSLGKSVARALGRKYQRISLGGITDESLFRGHRKTYVGAQCGRIMDALKRCRADNPVIVLDEIDKLGHDWRGDPESALLEILDPEQNKTFRDNYLEVDFDLSNVLFIATANSLNMSNALKDRMEIIEIPGYSEDDKVAIAREHLIARAARDTGWDKKNIHISDSAIRHIIQKYTSEQGVRELQRELTAILRRQLLLHDGEDKPTKFTIEKIDDLLSLQQSAGFVKRIGFGVRV